jgi:glycerol-3-phosphate dehydrogenase (NAD(P)+)
MKIRILGTGSWGTALAQVAADNGNDVIMWGINENQVNDIEVNHRNSAFFETEVSKDVHASTDMHVIEDADIVLAAVPTMALEEVLTKAAALIDHPVIIINVAKGFHPVTHERLSVVIEKIVPAEKRTAVVSLIGPSHAEEVILRQLTVINAVSTDEASAEKIQKIFSNDYFRVYRNTDVIGAETGVALKNVMAIASGILEGFGQGDNARAALMTRGLAEMTRYGLAQGGRPETFLGLDGVGDLIVTCTSQHSRNFMAGYQIGKDGTAEKFMKENTKTVEGIYACKVVHEDAIRQGIDMPITNEVYAVLYEGKNPVEAVKDLMGRSLKAETNVNFY